MEKRRARDEENGCEPAELLEGLVTRKLVKQTVMTVAYGLTTYGARNQLDKRLRELDSDQIPIDKLRSIRDYLQERIFDVLEANVYQGSKQIMVLVQVILAYSWILGLY